jgi:hypothetical protein
VDGEDAVIADPGPAPNLIEMDILEEPVSFRGKKFDVVEAQGLFEYAGEFQSRPPVPGPAP